MHIRINQEYIWQPFNATAYQFIIHIIGMEDSSKLLQRKNKIAAIRSSLVVIPVITATTKRLEEKIERK